MSLQTLNHTGFILLLLLEEALHLALLLALFPADILRAPLRQQRSATLLWRWESTYFDTAPRMSIFQRQREANVPHRLISIHLDMSALKAFIITLLKIEKILARIHLPPRHLRTKLPCYRQQGTSNRVGLIRLRHASFWMVS
jgi:hypothetical protein